MTEEEAKTKWCPMVRFHKGMDGDVYCSRPTGTATDDSALCIASDCMMWRYVDYEYVIPNSVPPSSKGKLEGYCGLAK